MRGDNPICAIYARVSTADQAEKYSLPSQLAAMQKHAAERGYRTSPEFTFVDDCSGSSLDRPDLDRLRDLVKGGAVDVVLAYTLDRVSRDVGDVVFVKKEFQRHGAKLDFVCMTMDDSPMGELFFHLTAAVAQCERRTILERTERGRREKAREGFVNQRTYGYRYLGRAQGKRGELVIDEHEAAGVRQMAEWRIEGGSLRRVATRLNESEWKPMKGGTWNPATVAKILSNAIYVGTTYYGRREAIEPKKRRTAIKRSKRRNAKSSARLRPESEWIPITVPRILDDETFAKLQAINARNREMLCGRPSMNYGLKGLVWCGRCGKKCRGHQNSGRPLYRCDFKDPVTFRRACWAGGVSAARLEDTVWTAVMDTISDVDLLRKTLQQHREEIFHAQESTDQYRSEVEEKLKAARRREANLKEMTADAAPDAFAQIRGEWKLAQARRLELERQLAALLPPTADNAISQDALSAVANAFRKMRELATREERNETFQRLVKRIDYADGHAEIECDIPVKRYCLQQLVAAIGLWSSNVLVFASWYWRLDGGGPKARERRKSHDSGAFLFPQMQMRAENWKPGFVDYLFLAFNTSTAFSPTDVPVLSRWAKVMMMIQSSISLGTVVILAARAVNVL